MGRRRAPHRKSGASFPLWVKRDGARYADVRRRTASIA